MSYPKTTHDSATEDNDTATVTVSPETSESVYLTHISAYFDGSITDLTVTVKDDTTEVWRGLVPTEDGADWSFNIPLKITAGEDLVVELEASGTGGTSGTLHVWYFKGE